MKFFALNCARDYNATKPGRFRPVECSNNSLILEAMTRKNIDRSQEHASLVGQLTPKKLITLRVPECRLPAIRARLTDDHRGPLWPVSGPLESLRLTVESGHRASVAGGAAMSGTGGQADFESRSQKHIKLLDDGVRGGGIRCGSDVDEDEHALNIRGSVRGKRALWWGRRILGHPDGQIQLSNA
jgi:hypothetical protein